MKQYNFPLVSIVIPSYNHGEYIVETIKSVLSQDYKNIELIIIDDGSKDHSVNNIKLLQKACKNRCVRFEFRMRGNKGLCATLNEGIQWCKGKYICILASDDIFLPNKISIQSTFLEEHQNTIAIFSGVKLMDQYGKIVDQRLSNKLTYSFEDIILNKHDLPASTQMIRLDKLKEVGCYNEKMKIEDWYLLLKLTVDGGLVEYIPQALCAYREHGANFSKQVDIMAFEKKKILAEYKNHPLFSKAEYKINRDIAKNLYSKKYFFKAFIYKLKSRLKYISYKLR